MEHANRLSLRGHQVGIVIPRHAIDREIGECLSDKVHLHQAAYPLTPPANAWDKLRIVQTMAAAVPPCDVIVATHTPTTLVSLLAGRLQGKGLPVWFYMDYPGMFTNRPAEAWLLRRALAWHCGALTLSQHSAEELRSFTPGDVRCVGIGLSNYDVLRATPRQMRADGKIQIMYLGDFRPRKGLADFLAAAEQVYAAHPEIVLRLVLKEEGEFFTPVPHEVIYRPGTRDLAACYAGSDMFVSSSWHEGFGLPPLEAMTCGTPVVLTDSGGVQEYARPGENCLLTPARQPQLLAQAMRRLLEQSNLRADFQKAGPPTAAQFTWEKASLRLEQALGHFLSAA